MRIWTAIAVMMVGCGTVPGVDLGPVEQPKQPEEPAPIMVWLPEVDPSMVGAHALPVVDVINYTNLGQCRPCETAQGGDCCGVDGWTGTVPCGGTRAYLMGCRQMAGADRGCGQDVVVGRRVCE